MVSAYRAGDGVGAKDRAKAPSHLSGRVPCFELRAQRDRDVYVLVYGACVARRRDSTYYQLHCFVPKVVLQLQPLSDHRFRPSAVSNFGASHVDVCRLVTGEVTVAVGHRY